MPRGDRCGSYSCCYRCSYRRYRCCYYARLGYYHSAYDCCGYGSCCGYGCAYY